jgi:hypothetical protein
MEPYPGAVSSAEYRILNNAIVKYLSVDLQTPLAATRYPGARQGQGSPNARL